MPNQAHHKMFDDFYQKFYFVLPNPYQKKVLGIYEDVFVRMEERLEAEICILKDLAHTNP